MDGIVELLDLFPVWPLPETAVRMLCNMPPACPIIHYVMLSFPFCRQSSGPPPRSNDPTRPPAMVTVENEKNITVPRLSAAVAHAVIDVLYSVVANRHQHPTTYTCTPGILQGSPAGLLWLTLKIPGVSQGGKGERTRQVFVPRKYQLLVLEPPGKITKNTFKQTKKSVRES